MCPKSVRRIEISADSYHDPVTAGPTQPLYLKDNTTPVLLADLSSHTKVQMPTLHVQRKLGAWQTNSPSAHFKKCIKRFRKLATASAKSRKKMRRFARKD